MSGKHTTVDDSLEEIEQWAIEKWQEIGVRVQRFGQLDHLTGIYAPPVVKEQLRNLSVEEADDKAMELLRQLVDPEQIAVSVYRNHATTQEAATVVSRAAFPNAPTITRQSPSSPQQTFIRDDPYRSDISHDR